MVGGGCFVEPCLRKVEVRLDDGSTKLVDFAQVHLRVLKFFDVLLSLVFLPFSAIIRAAAMFLQATNA